MVFGSFRGNPFTFSEAFFLQTDKQQDRGKDNSKGINNNIIAKVY